jgi:hypothetical protein
VSRQSSGRHPFLDRAKEEGEGTELMELLHHGAFLEQEREGAQGVEVIEDPDATLPASALKGGSPGHEILTGDAVGLGKRRRRGSRKPVRGELVGVGAEPVLWPYLTIVPI